MKKLLLTSFVIFISLLVGCSNEKEKTYSVIVVEGSENISEEFSGFENDPVIGFEYFSSIEAATDKYPDYDIEQTPAVLIFEDSGGVLKQLEFKTYNVDKAIEFLEKKREQY